MRTVRPSEPAGLRVESSRPPARGSADHPLLANDALLATTDDEKKILLRAGAAGAGDLAPHAPSQSYPRTSRAAVAKHAPNAWIYTRRGGTGGSIDEGLATLPGCGPSPGDPLPAGSSAHLRAIRRHRRWTQARGRRSVRRRVRRLRCPDRASIARAGPAGLRRGSRTRTPPSLGDPSPSDRRSTQAPGRRSVRRRVCRARSRDRLSIARAGPAGEVGLRAPARIAARPRLYESHLHNGPRAALLRRCIQWPSTGSRAQATLSAGMRASLPFAIRHVDPERRGVSQLQQ